MGKCEQCGKESPALIMSMYSTRDLCLDCKLKEQQRPDYEQVVKREVEAVRKGNMYYTGQE